jgi:hypothetical protein
VVGSGAFECGEDRFGQRHRRPDRYQGAPARARSEDLARAARAVGGHDRDAERERFDEDRGQPLPTGRQHAQVRSCEVGVRVPHEAGQLDRILDVQIGAPLLELRSLLPLTEHQEAHVSRPSRDRDRVEEATEVLRRGQATHGHDRPPGPRRLEQRMVRS